MPKRSPEKAGVTSLHPAVRDPPLEEAKGGQVRGEAEVTSQAGEGMISLVSFSPSLAVTLPVYIYIYAQLRAGHCLSTVAPRRREN